MANRIIQRHDTAANWSRYNPILAEGELGFVTDQSNRYKIGDGITAWNNLPLQGFNGNVVNELGNDEGSVLSQKFATEKLTELESYIGKSPIISASLQVKDFADTILEIYVRPKFELTDDIRKDRFYLSYWGGNGVAQGGMQKTDGSWIATINVPKTTYKQDGLTLWYANNDNYEIAFLADEALYPNVTGYPYVEFRISLSNSIHPAIRAILDKKELTEKIESIDNTTLTDGIVYSELKVADEPGNARVYSEYFKAGNVVSLKVLEATSGNANDGGISFYGFFADDTYETLWDAPAGGHSSKLIELSKDYDNINCYANPSKVQYHLTIGVVSSSYKNTEDNKSKINELADGIVYSELKVADEPGNASIYSEYFKAGNVVALEVLEATSGDANSGGVSFYGFLADGSYDTLWNAPSGGNTRKIIELSKDYDNINCYANPANVQYHFTIGILPGLHKDVKKNESEINKLTDSIRTIEKQTTGTRVEFSEGTETPIINNLFLMGAEGEIVVSEESLTASYEIYGHNVNDTSDFPYVNYGSIIKGESKKITFAKEHDFIRLYPIGEPKSNAIASIMVYESNSLSMQLERLESQMDLVEPIRVLILGDSYSQNGGHWVNPMMEGLPQNSSYISLAVSSATIKDRYADRNTYPYTSRPISSDNAGNRNTLACQIEKLKRLMQGTDLDDGETAIYQSKEEYPNVIIIEGGMNDGTDADTSNYYAQLEKVVSGVWRKRYSWSDDLEQGSVTIKTPLEEVDRTCFAGAYRYLADELLRLFPNAQIFITTCSSISYRNGSSISQKRTIMAEQQRLCSDIFAFNLIDWHRDGQINSIANYPLGSGTESDPYIWGGHEGEYADTNDQLHPNARGGRKYGRLAALRIKQTFLNIGDL